MEFRHHKILAVKVNKLIMQLEKLFCLEGKICLVKTKSGRTYETLASVSPLVTDSLKISQNLLNCHSLRESAGVHYSP